MKKVKEFVAPSMSLSKINQKSIYNLHNLAPSKKEITIVQTSSRTLSRVEVAENPQFQSIQNSDLPENGLILNQKVPSTIKQSYNNTPETNSQFKHHGVSTHIMRHLDNSHRTTPSPTNNEIKIS
jgi:hypothetical protein